MTFDMSGSPVSVDKAPGPGYVYSSPRVTELVPFDPHSWSVAGTLGVPLDHLTVQPSITEITDDTVIIRRIG